ncbi:hypothetical protein Bbelb_109970 [Branchiostoma belcheri]|nr:hypothetical protein Bbelb_109970 [Branchiostoma belcheri]
MEKVDFAKRPSSNTRANKNYYYCPRLYGLAASRPRHPRRTGAAELVSSQRQDGQVVVARSTTSSRDTLTLGQNWWERRRGGIVLRPDSGLNGPLPCPWE